jgi:diguanylate cyclase (GGDEF)-like protein/PAS domain S-box-containing protein
MLGVWQDVLTPLAIVALTVTLWSLARDRIDRWRRPARTAVLGLFAGLGTAAVLILLADRTATLGAAPHLGLVALAGAFGGPVAGLVAFAIAAVATAVHGGPTSPTAVLLVLNAVAGLGLSAVDPAVRTLPRHLLGLTVAGTAATAAVSVLIAAVAPATAAVAAANTAVFTGFGAVLLWRDTQRRRRDRTNAILELAIDTLPDALSIKDIDGHFLIANPATAAVLGVADRDAIIGASDVDFFSPEVAAGFRTDELNAVAAVRPTPMEQKVPRPDGSVTWYATLKAPVFGRGGALVGLITHNRDITAHKRLEDDLAESRRRLGDALRLMSQGLVMFDGAGRIVFCNERYAELFPLTAELRKPGARLTDIIRAAIDRGEFTDAPPPDISLDEWAEQLSRALRADGRRQFETHDGRWLECDVRATTDGGCHVVVADVTERRQSEARLRVAEERWNFALESSNQGVWDVDARAGRTFYSPTWKHILGYRDDELSDAHDLWLDLMHPDDRPAVEKLARDHLAGAVPVFDAEFRMRHKDGRWIWVHDRGRVLETDAAGRSMRAIGTHTDITARKEAEAALRANETRFRSLFDLLPVGLALVDVADDRILEHSPALADMLGVTGEALTAMRLADVFADPAARQALTDVTAKNGPPPAECQLRRPDGTTVPVIVTGSPPIVTGGIRQILLVFQDISQRRGYEERLWRLANIDALTELPNRMLFNNRLAAAIERARRNDRPFAVALFDLDNFKDVNDSFGHGAGDRLLAETARRVHPVLRATDTLARIGGDEFAVILEDIDGPDDAARPIAAINRAVNAPLDVTGAPRRFSASVGVALFPDDATDPDELVMSADIALYRAKQSGRNRYEFFRPALREAIDRRQHHIVEVEQALALDRFAPTFEPIVAADAGRPCVGLVVAPCLTAPDGRRLGREHLAAAAADPNLTETLGRLARRQAIAAAAAWRRDGLGCGRIGFDLTPADLRSDAFVDDLVEMLEAERLDTDTISLRLTGVALASRGSDRLVPMLTRLHGMGVELALSEFGSGDASLPLLQHLPVDRVCFAAGLVARLAESPTDQAIVIGLVDLVHRLGIATAAAGVATEFQADFLTGLGCEHLSGPLFAEPLTAAAAGAFLRRHGLPVDDVADIGDAADGWRHHAVA